MTVLPAPAQAPTRQPASGSQRVWWAAAVVVVIPALIPPVSLLWQVLAGEATVDLGAGRLIELMISTLGLTVAVTVTALTLGMATAWLTTRTDVPYGKTWMIVAALPLVVPSYLAALTLIGATGEGGLLSSWVGWAVPTPYGFVGAWLALSIFLAPMAHLIVVPALRQVDPAIEEAAVGLGASRRRVFATITLPQVRPALVSASLLVGLYVISDFGAVSLLRFDTFTRAIYTLYVGQIDRRPAAFLSLILVVVALLLVFIERRSRSRGRYHSSKPKRPASPHQLSPLAKTGATMFLMLFGLVSLVLPISVMVFWLSRGLAFGQTTGAVWDEAFRSVGVSLLTAVVAAVAAFPVAMVTSRRRSRYSDLTETTVWGAYALPHIAVGVGMVGFALTIARSLYQTVLLLVVTYLAMFLAQAMSATQDSLLRASPDLEDASRGLGRGSWSTTMRITVPLAKPGIVAGASLVFLSVMKELPATLLLRPNGFETLAVRIWSTTGEGFYTQAALAGLTLLAVSIAPLFAVTRRDLRN